MTSEYSLTGTSTLARTNLINMSTNDINFERLNEVQENEKIISTTILNFIGWIAEKYEEIEAYVEDRYSKLHKELVRHFRDTGVHLRKPKMIALYIIALEVFFVYGHSINAISNKKINKIIRKARKIFCESAIRQTVLVNQNDPINMYFTTIFDLEASNRVKIASLGKETYDPKLIGFQDDKYYYFIPNETYNRVFKAWRARGRIFPFGESDLKMTLENKGIIEVEKDKNGNRSKTYKKKTVWTNHRIRTMNVKKSALKRYMKGEDKLQDNKDDELELVFKMLPKNIRSK